MNVREKPVKRVSGTWNYKFPIGAEASSAGVHFRVWAADSKQVSVQWMGKDTKTEGLELEAETGGYFSGFAAEARPGDLYKFKLDSGTFPDPASRFQPEGPHGPSQVVDGSSFRWSDKAWQGVPREGQVVYELHVGTFTPEGTWRGAMNELPELGRLGITLLEIMPVADFPGRFGWGYDGVNLFAPTRLYGTPDDFRAFVDKAHSLGLGVILDVVYNHLGPDGNYLKHFSKNYFTDQHRNEWGQALNFDGEQCEPVREFFAANAAYWIEEFHLDGLRLDATQQIFDFSPEHILAKIAREARKAAGDREIWLVAENETQESKLAQAQEEGGFGLDALWNDDFHHAARVAATGRNEAYYSDFKGTPQELISAVKWGYLYQGQWFGWQKKHRGEPAWGLDPWQFVNCLQNHDQVANSLRGLRLHKLTTPGRLRALTALCLLAPGTPMFFQGQEFAASAPFHYFADHHDELAKMVSSGRREFMRQFPSVGCPEAEALLPDPGSENTFLACKLNLSERQKNSDVYQMHRDLLRLRREDPVFGKSRRRGLDGAVLASEAFALRFFADDHQDRLLLINLGPDLSFHSVPEPLLAPPLRKKWIVMWSSENPCYGGGGVPPFEVDGTLRILGHSALVLSPDGAHGQAASSH